MPTCIARPLLGTSGFLPSIARIAPRTPRRPRLWPGGDGAGGSPEDEEDVAERPVASKSSSDDADDEAGSEARSAQLFLQLSDIAWYIAGAGCYTPPFISGVQYSRVRIHPSVFVTSGGKKKHS